MLMKLAHVIVKLSSYLERWQSRRILLTGKNEIVHSYLKKDIRQTNIRQTTCWTVLRPLSPENFDIDTISRHVEDEKGAGNNADFEGETEGDQHECLLC